MQTTDPHSQNESLTNNINQLIYEFLVGRDKKLDLVPALAVSWQQIDPVTWRFKLRPGVKFHDGTPFTADDVVFSFERARAETSQLRVYANAAGIPKKIDDLTVEFTTSGPNPIELEHIATINIMSKAWCEKNGATKPQNFTAEGGHDHRAPGQRHRPVHAQVARARREDGAGQEPELVGHQGGAVRRQRRRGDLHADRLGRDAGGGAASPARSTSSTIRRRRTCRA